MSKSRRRGDSDSGSVGGCDDAHPANNADPATAIDRQAEAAKATLLALKGVAEVAYLQLPYDGLAELKRHLWAAFATLERRRIELCDAHSVPGVIDRLRAANGGHTVSFGSRRAAAFSLVVHEIAVDAWSALRPAVYNWDGWAVFRRGEGPAPRLAEDSFLDSVNVEYDLRSLQGVLSPDLSRCAAAP